MFAAINTFLSGSAAQIKTQSFPPGTTSWTAPADVSNLISVSGYGQDGYPTTWTYPFTSQSTLSFFMTDTGWTDYSQLYAHFQSRLTAVNSGAPGVRYIANTGDYYIYFNTATNTLWAQQNGSATSNAYGTATSSWSLPTSGAITTSLNTNATRGIIYIPQYANGAASVAFGKTFSGGFAGGAAPLTTYSNVAVTPGTTYSVQNVANSASLTISYYSAF